jgi:hypothetical protein
MEHELWPLRANALNLVKFGKKKKCFVTCIHSNHGIKLYLTVSNTLNVLNKTLILETI